MNYQMIVEQRELDKYRNIFNPSTGIFQISDSISLLYDRKFKGIYGWISGFGSPPGKHLDIMTITSKKYALGDFVNIKIIGIFIRNDKDNKFIGLELDRSEDDLFELPITEQNMLKQIYPNIRSDEGWYGKNKAESLLSIYNLSYHKIGES